MNKSDLITKILEKKYLTICRRLTKGRDYKDLHQELILHFLEQTDELIGKIQKPDAYIYRVLLSMISKRGKFYEKYRTYICEDVEPKQDEPTYNHTIDERYNKWQNTSGAIYWCDREIFNAYLERGNINQTSRELNIPLSSIHRIIERTKQTIKTMMQKPKILIMMQHNVTALQYHRQIVPHERLTKTHADEFEFTYCRPENAQEETNIMWMTDEQLKEFSLVVFLRQIAFNPALIQITIDKLKSLGVKILIDIDDNWELPKAHYMYQASQKMGVPASTTSTLKQVDWVTTTTTYFATKIREYNTNVTILPNCISPDAEQFQKKPIENARVRFGWIGGVFHGADMLIAKGSFERFNSSGLLSDIQICLGGFNLNGENAETIKQKKATFKRDRKNIIRDYRTEQKHKVFAIDNINFMLPEYLQMEEIITDDYKICDRDYVDYLRQYTPDMEHLSYDKPYRRLWGKPIDKYGELYNEIDVSLVPLKDNDFNRCKSELKIVEAGYMGKAVIVSDVTPYAEWIKDGVNGVKINPNRNGIDWFVAIKRLAKEPELRKDLSLALEETIKENFDLDEHNKTRVQLYKRLIQ